MSAQLLTLHKKAVLEKLNNPYISKETLKKIYQPDSRPDPQPYPKTDTKPDPQPYPKADTKPDPQQTRLNPEVEEIINEFQTDNNIKDKLKNILSKKEISVTDNLALSEIIKDLTSREVLNNDWRIYLKNRIAAIKLDKKYNEKLFYSVYDLNLNSVFLKIPELNIYNSAYNPEDFQKLISEIKSLTDGYRSHSDDLTIQQGVEREQRGREWREKEKQRKEEREKRQREREQRAKELKEEEQRIREQISKDSDKRRQEIPIDLLTENLIGLKQEISEVKKYADQYYRGEISRSQLDNSLAYVFVGNKKTTNWLNDVKNYKIILKFATKHNMSELKNNTELRLQIRLYDIPELDTNAKDLSLAKYEKVVKYLKDFFGSYLPQSHRDWLDSKLTYVRGIEQMKQQAKNQKDQQAKNQQTGFPISKYEKGKTGSFSMSYPSGNTQYLYEKKDGILHGNFIEYTDGTHHTYVDRNGKTKKVFHKIMEGEYRNGKKSGRWTEYYDETYIKQAETNPRRREQQEVKSTGMYYKGNKEGKWIFYTPKAAQKEGEHRSDDESYKYDEDVKYYKDGKETTPPKDETSSDVDCYQCATTLHTNDQIFPYSKYQKLTEDEVKKLRLKTRKWMATKGHPDKGGDKEVFQQVNDCMNAFVDKTC